MSNRSSPPHAQPRVSVIDQFADSLSEALHGLPDRGAEPRVIVLVPAHNEANGIEVALRSLERQTRPADLIVVVADNCSDGTAELVAARGGAVVVPSIANKDKKAGALNQVLDRILPDLADTDAILVMDADSALDQRFIRCAMARLGIAQQRGRKQATVGGVGGTFSGGRGGGFVGMLQRNEYARYARDVRRMKGRVLVLTGTAAIFTVGALRMVVAGRTSGRLPGGGTQVYGTGVLTEDNELTLALLHLGYAIVSPKECLLETEVMTTWGSLWDQRVRWKRGALENLMEYGITGVTARYWVRQVVTHLGVLVTAVYLTTIFATLAVNGTVQLHPLWLAVTGIFVAERVTTVSSRGWKQMLVAGTLVVEMSFDLFLQAAQVKALLETLTHSDRKW